ncbi:MAG: TonB-dependent receptor [Leptospiraceae bacterium]|nr:TonB-dependent receptor [Leptospiraceae bacterium]
MDVERESRASILLVYSLRSVRPFPVITESGLLPGGISLQRLLSNVPWAVLLVLMGLLLPLSESSARDAVRIGRFIPMGATESNTEQALRDSLERWLVDAGFEVQKSGDESPATLSEQNRQGLHLFIGGYYNRSSNGVLNVYVQIYHPETGEVIDAYHRQDMAERVNRYADIELPGDELKVSDQEVIETVARKVSIQVRVNVRRRVKTDNLDRHLRTTEPGQTMGFDIASEDPDRASTEVFQLLEEQEVVTATRTRSTLRDAPAAVYVITAQQIKERGYRTLTDALQDLPGFDIVRNYGIFPELIHQRGLVGNNQKTLLYIDGVLDNNLTEAAILAGSARFPLHNVKRIEVVAGPASALYGANAFNGVINIITQDYEGDPTNQMEVMAGGYNNLQRPGYSGSVSLRGQSPGEVQPFTYSVSGYMYRTVGPGFSGVGRLDRSDMGKNDPLYAVESELCGGQCNPDGNSVGYWWSPYFNVAGEDTYNITGKFTLGNFRFQTVNWQYLQGEGTFANGTQQIDTDKLGYDGSAWNFENHSFTLGYLHEFSPFLNLDTEFSIRHTEILSSSGEQYPANPGVQTYFFPDPAGASGIHDYARPDRAYDFKQRITYDAGSKATTVVGWEGNHTVVPEAYGSEKRIRTSNYALYGQQSYRPISKLQFTGGYRYDHSTDYGDSHTPRLGAVFHATDNLTVKLLLGTGFRAPTAWELYNETAQRLRNDRLEPERMRSVEVGIAYRLKKRYYFSVQAYRNDIENLILEVQTSQNNPAGGNWNQNQNVGDARITGVESRTDFLILDNLSLNLNHTYSRGYYLNLPYTLAVSPTTKGRPGEDPILDAAATAVSQLRSQEAAILAQLEQSVLNAVAAFNPELLNNQVFLRRIRSNLPAQLLDLDGVPARGPIPNIASHKFNLGLTYYPWRNVSLNVRMNYVSERRTISTNPEKTIPAYYFWVANVRWENILGNPIYLQLMVRNLTNEQYWDPGIRTATGGYYPTRHPIENRNIWLTVGYRF